MLTKLSELIELIGLAELIKSTNQPFNPINHQSLGSGFRVQGYLILDFGFRESLGRRRRLCRVSLNPFYKIDRIHPVQTNNQ